jgi:hypothetical protein
VTIVRCDVGGGYDSSAAYAGIRSKSSSLYVYDSVATGFRYSPAGGGFPSGPGKPGLALDGGTLFASGSSFRGGQGGPGGLCTPGSPGGPGLELSGVSPQAWLLATVLNGGPGGCALDFPYCTSCGQTGPPSSVLAGSIQTVAGTARHYELGSPASAGSGSQLEYKGKTGDLVHGVIGLAQQPLLALPLGGALLPTAPQIVLVHGAADSQGKLSLLLGVPPIPSGFALTAYLQAGAIATNGSLWLGAASALTLVP